MYKFILAVAVISLSACAAKEEVQGQADSTAVVVDSTATDSTKLNTDSVKGEVVAPEAPAAK